MTSTLASKLLGVTLADAVSEVLWRNAELASVQDAAATVNLDTARDLASRLSGDELNALGRLITDSGTLSVLLGEVTDPLFIEGALSNPNLSTADLVKIRDEAPTPVTKARAHVRITRLDGFKSAVKSGDAQTTLSVYDSLMVNTEVAGLVDLLNGPDYEDYLIGLASLTQATLPEGSSPEESQASAEEHLKRLEYRSRVLDALKARNEERYDDVMGVLLGLNDEPAKAKTVDLYIANWLCTSESFQAMVAQALLIPDGGVRKSEVAPEFASRLTSAARERFKKHDTLWDLVAYRTTGQAKPLKHPHGHIAMSAEQLLTLRMADMSASEISGLVFNSNCEIETDDLLYLLDGIEMLPLATFLKGQHQRWMQPGQVAALLGTLDESQLVELDGLIGEDPIDGVPWYSELLPALPKRWAGELKKGDAKVLADAAFTRLGEDADAWESLLVKSADWNGSFNALLDEVASN